MEHEGYTDTNYSWALETFRKNMKKSSPSIQMNTMWKPFIKKTRLKKTDGDIWFISPKKSTLNCPSRTHGAMDAVFGRKVFLSEIIWRFWFNPSHS